MQQFWSRLAVFLGKRLGVVILVTLILVGLAGLGIGRLKFATGQDAYLNSDERVAIDNKEYQDLFGGQAMLTVIKMDKGHTIAELFDAEGRATFAKVKAEVKKSPFVKGVVTPLDAMVFTDRLITGRMEEGDQALPATESVAGKALLAAASAEEPGSPGATARLEDSTTTLNRLAEVGTDQTMDNPKWVEFLLYDNVDEIRKAQRPTMPDATTAQIITRLGGNLSLEDEGLGADAHVAAMKKLSFANAEIVTTGAPIVLGDLNDYLRGGMLTLGGIALGIMLLIVALLFDVRWRLLSMGIIVVGVTLAFGLAGFLGIPLTVVTIAGLPVLLGIGIDYAIQMHARVEEEVILDRAEHPIQESARKLGPALLIVTFDAIFAFMALQLAKVPMIRDFGLLLAVGVAVICVCSIVLPMAPLGWREYHKPTTGGDFTEGVLGKVVVKLGSLKPVMAIPFAVAAVAIFLGGVLVESDLEMETDPVKWVNQGSQTIKDFHWVERNAGAANELAVYVTTNEKLSVYDDSFTTWVHGFTKRIMNDPRARGRLLTASTAEAFLGDSLEIPGATDLAPSGDLVRQAMELAPEDIRSATVSDDGKAFNIVYRTGPGDLKEAIPLVDEVRGLGDPTVAGHDTTMPAGARAVPSGLAVVGVGLLQNLEANRVELTYWAIAFVFLFLALRLRSIIRSLLSLVPVLIAVGSSSLIAWALGLRLSPMTAVGGPIIIAACTEFTSIILLRFVEERQRGLPPQEAADVSAARTGRAFIVSALTASSGVAVLSFSSLPLLQDFGRIVAMNVVVAILCALVVLPPMLVWAEHRGWVTRGLVTVPDEPYVDTPGSALLGTDDPA